MRNKRYIKKNRSFKSKLVFTILMAMLLIAGASSVIAKNHLNTRNIYVSSGDTIWSIARGIQQSNSNINIQNIVCDIEKINDLKGSNIYIGQVLVIPIY